MLRSTTILLLMLTLGACAQTPAPMTRMTSIAPLMCDPETGRCSIPGHDGHKMEGAKAIALLNTLDVLFNHYATWTAQEVAVVLDNTHEQALALLSKAEQEGTLVALHSCNGSIRSRK